MRVIQISGWLGETEKHAELLVEELFLSLREHEADVACFRYIDIKCSLATYAGRARRLCADFLVPSHFHYFCVRRAHQGFLGCLSKNERAQQKKRERRIASAFCRFRVKAFSAQGIAELLKDAEEVAKKSYQRRLERLEYDAAKGWLAGYILYLDEKPSAFWIGSLRNGVFLSNYLAFDPACRHYSPGMYLMLKVMESLSSEESHLRADRIDFGIGDAVYKRRLSNYHREEALLHIFALRPRPIFGNVLHSTLRCFNGLAKSLRTWKGAIRRVLVPTKKVFSA
jgi:hypothetical protein